MREAKPCTLFTTMTSNPADHVRYLLDGHGQLEGTEPEVWTKGIPKASRIRQKVAAYWDDVHELWEERTAKQAKMTGKQVFVALPNDIKSEDVTSGLFPGQNQRDFFRHFQRPKNQPFCRN